MSATLTAPDEAPGRLVEMSADVRAAVLVDPAGGLVAAGGIDRARARRMAGLAHDLLGVADAASGPNEHVEAQTAGGAVFAVRNARYTLACVTERLALPALVLYDLRQTLLALEEEA
ncbi:MAG: roadblock/LC7 domain-containing protein [Actinomycetota bacterium]|nr:roadblock/LC7 domain-containing protein [Actinomycetota bacterium]